MACGTITRGSVIDDCDDIPPGGTRARLLLANFDEVVSYTEDVNGQITAITLADGATLHEFTGFRNDVKSSQEVLKPEIGIPKFKHNVGFVIYENTQIQKNNIENLVRGRVVAIVENNGKDVNSFEVVGVGVGLTIVAGVIRDAHANGGFFVLSLATPDDEDVLEPQLPQTLFITPDYAAALAYLETLLPVES